MVYIVNGREHKSSWIAALSRWNAGKDVWCTPRKGTQNYAQVKAIQSSMMRKGPPPRPKSAQGMSGAGLLGRIDRPSTAPLPSPQAFEYRNVPMATVGGTGTAVPMATVVGTVVSQPPKAKKRAIKLASVADVVDESDANGPWEDVDERSNQQRQFQDVTKRLQSKTWRNQQIRKYGKVREYGKRAPIKKKRRRVKT